MRKSYSLIIILTAIGLNVFAQDTTSSKLYFDIPIIDFGYQSLAMKTSANHRNNLGADANSKANFGDFIKSFGNPSMQQSLNWSASRITLTGYGVNKLSDLLVKRNTKFKKIINQGIREITFTGANAFLIYYPIGDGWTHEEYHHAILTTGGVYAYNNINSFNALGAGHISVTRIRDEDLTYFKKNDPIGFNRMLAAGGEGELLLTRNLQLNNFYHKSQMPITLYNLLIMSTIVSYPNSDAKDSDTDELHERELEETEISQRDFTGPDYRGWVWHLFKPNVPYDSLGTHPTGNGIDRYVSYADLSGEELDFLKKVGRVMRLNYISPMTIGIYRISLGKGRYINFAIKTNLNGFGYDINPEVYLKTSKYNLFFGVHNYHNYDKSFFGIEMGAYKNPINWLNKEFLYDARLILWGQPENQEFKTNKSSLGGLAGLKVYYPLTNWLYTFFDIEGKSKGWVAGNPFLKSNVSVRIGCNMNIKQ
jgi:hypothetical protein